MRRILLPYSTLLVVQFSRSPAMALQLMGFGCTVGLQSEATTSAG